MELHFTVNGHAVASDAPPQQSLMRLLRRLGWTGVKNGCDNGDCGTCAVLVDGRAVNACLMFAAKAEGTTITTIEGLGDNGGLHVLQRTAVESGSVQCGFCTPGILLTAADLLARNPDPTETEVREALAGNLCRCTGYVKQIEGVLAAAAESAGDQP